MYVTTAHFFYLPACLPAGDYKWAPSANLPPAGARVEERNCICMPASRPAAAVCMLRSVDPGAGAGDAGNLHGVLHFHAVLATGGRAG